MKKLLIAALAAMLAAGAAAKDIKTVVFTPTPKLTCQNCEKKVKSNIRFVAGTKSIATSVKDNTVTITYDADKATIKDYEKAFKAIGREVKVKEQPKTAGNKKQ